MLRHYVCDFLAPAPLMCTHEFFLSLITLRTWMTLILYVPHVARDFAAFVVVQ